MARLSVTFALLTVCLAVCLVTVSAAPMYSRRSASDACGLCRFFIGYVEDFVGQNKSVAEITSILSNLCYLAPGEMRGACQGFVDYYVPFLVAYLIDTNNPAAVCTATGVCPADNAKLVAVPEKAMTDTCTLCETITGFVETYLYANKTEQEIQDALDVLCSLMPDSAQCKTMVDNYLAAIFMFLRSYANPHLVCAGIDLCPMLASNTDIHNAHQKIHIN